VLRLQDAWPICKALRRSSPLLPFFSAALSLTTPTHTSRLQLTGDWPEEKKFIGAHV
jgi:hypothetical protein